VSRRPHPYFGQINRLEQAGVPASGGAGSRAPTMTPGEQQGVLWQAFRQTAEDA
jgi:hypothetical protein